MGSFVKALWRNRAVRQAVVIAAVQILAAVVQLTRDDDIGG
jgi:hypothetical protein